MPSLHFDLGTVTEGTQLKAQVITGEDMYDNTGKTNVTAEVVTVKRLLGPLAQNDVDIIRCVGLNYVKHSKCVSFQLSTCQLTRVARQSAKPDAPLPPSHSSSSNRTHASKTTAPTSSFPKSPRTTRQITRASCVSSLVRMPRTYRRIRLSNTSLRTRVVMIFRLEGFRETPNSLEAFHSGDSPRGLTHMRLWGRALCALV